MYGLAFKSKPFKRYQQYGSFEAGLTSNDLVIQKIYTSNKDFFQVELADPFEKYRLSRVNSNTIVNSWNSDPIKF